MMRKLAGWTIVVLLFLPSLGCKEQKDLRGDEKLEVLVATDRKLAKQENDLLSRRGTLQRERSQVRDKRAELATRKAALSEEDADGKAELEKEESQLVRLETQLASQEVALNKKLEVVLEKKSTLATKATGEVKGDLLRRREHSLVRREKDVARREAEFARRERQLAGREQHLAERQAKLCPRMAAATTTVVKVAAPSGHTRYTRRDVEPVYRSALKAMRTKGLLIADLPAGVDRLVTETRHAVAKKEYTKAKYSADQLLAEIRKIRVNRSFIGAKINRLSSALRRRPASGTKKEKVDALFRKATASYGDGRFTDANKKLNRIYSLLR